jgi:hypothetical protein
MLWLTREVKRSLRASRRNQTMKTMRRKRKMKLRTKKGRQETMKDAGSTVRMGSVTLIQAQRQTKRWRRRHSTFV